MPDLNIPVQANFQANGTFTATKDMKLTGILIEQSSSVSYDPAGAQPIAGLLGNGLVVYVPVNIPLHDGSQLFVTIGGGGAITLFFT